MRLRTLPLSLAGVVLGAFIASSFSDLNFWTVFFLFLTACLLQIFSNLSNELGDTLCGTDASDRQGIHYSIQDGLMTVPEMKRLILIVQVFCCVSGLMMSLFAFGFSLLALLFVAFGACAIWAAIHYTLGSNPYGYKGLGDIFVFLFFGLATVLGGFVICSGSFDNIRSAFLPAFAIGFFSVGVLNVNNIRDMISDARTRTTVALKLGASKARVYQTVLIALAWICLTLNSLITADCWLDWLYFVTLPFFVLHLRGVWTRTDRALDPMLPLLVLSTFLLSLLLGVSCL